MRAMPSPERYSSGNHLLDALAARDLDALRVDLEVITLAARDYTHVTGGLMAHVDFPIDAVLSVVATLHNGDTVEVGAVGCEGFVEVDAALEREHAPRTSFCQVGGRVGRIAIEAFQERLHASPSFSRRMRHNASAALFSAQQLAACNLKHTVLQRCARWLLMTADRVGGPRFVLTHDFLAIMLGVRRAGVSESAAALNAMGAITYHRGAVTVLRADLLEAAACECYSACKEAFTASLAG